MMALRKNVILRRPRSGRLEGRTRARPRSRFDAGALSIAIGGDAPDKLAEILGLAEIAIDRGEADIGDLIEARQRLHHQFADHVAGDFRLARAFELTHQGIDHALDAL